MLKSKNIHIFGHRGAAGLCFENTLPAIQRALEEGADGIEIDVWKTTDNEIVVFHDAYLHRLTEQHGFIYELSSEDIRAIKLKSGDAIPTLQAVVDLIKGSNVQLLVEIKHEDALEFALYILSNNLATTQYIVGSFFHTIIKQCKTVNPELQTAIMLECVPYRFDAYLQEINADYIAASIETYNTYFVNTIHSQNRKLLFYTVNTPVEMELAQQAAPFGIITNYPNLFIQK